MRIPLTLSEYFNSYVGFKNNCWCWLLYKRLENFMVPIHLIENVVILRPFKINPSKIFYWINCILLEAQIKIPVRLNSIGKDVIFLFK